MYFLYFVHVLNSPNLFTSTDNKKIKPVWYVELLDKTINVDRYYKAIKDSEICDAIENDIDTVYSDITDDFERRAIITITMFYDRNEANAYLELVDNLLKRYKQYMQQFLAFFVMNVYTIKNTSDDNAYEIFMDYILDDYYVDIKNLLTNEIIAQKESKSLKQACQYFKKYAYMYKKCMWYELHPILKNDFFLFHWIKTDFSQNNEITHESAQQGCIKKQVPCFLYDYSSYELQSNDDDVRKNMLRKTFAVWLKLCQKHKEKIVTNKQKMQELQNEWYKDLFETKKRPRGYKPGPFVDTYNQIVIALNVIRLFMNEHKMLMDEIEHVAIFVFDESYMRLKQLQYKTKLQMYFAINYLHSYKLYNVNINKNYKDIAHKKYSRCCALIHNSINQFTNFVNCTMDYLLHIKDTFASNNNFFTLRPYLNLDCNNFEFNEYVHFMILLSNKYDKHCRFVVNASIFRIGYNQKMYAYDYGVGKLIHNQPAEISVLENNRDKTFQYKTRNEIERCKEVAVIFVKFYDFLNKIKYNEKADTMFE
ncbi:hypothetical protein BDAP_001420 [Binucleata daphniae]